MKRIVIIIFILIISISSAFCVGGKGGVKKIVIDPGHGGVKPGAITKNSKEKDITLAVALKLGQLIKDNCPDVEVIYTRKTDVDVDLFERAHIANRNKADLFLSIHVNSSPKSEPTGMETFVMGLSKTSANLEVAKKENADILLEDNYESNYQGFDPRSPEGHIMFAMYQNAFIDKSLDFSAKIQKYYAKQVPSPNRGVKQAEFLVLYKTAMPSVLTEIGFMSNPDEEDYLTNPQGQGEIAYAIFNAFREYKAKEEDTIVPDDKVVINISGFVPGAKVTKKPRIEKEKTVASNEKPKQETSKPQEKEKPVEKEKAVEKEKPEMANIDKQETEKQESTKASEKANKSGIEYKIQFLISKTKLAENDKKLNGLTKTSFYQQDGLYRYTYGSAENIEKAKIILEEVRGKKFKDAFIIAFKEGRRIDLQEAIKYTEKN